MKNIDGLNKVSTIQNDQIIKCIDNIQNLSVEEEASINNWKKNIKDEMEGFKFFKIAAKKASIKGLPFPETIAEDKTVVIKITIRSLNETFMELSLDGQLKNELV